MAGSVKWRKTPKQAWTPGARVYASEVRKAVVSLLDYYAALVEAEAKNNAPWTDRTGNARQGLRGWVQENPNAVRLILQHSIVTYGIFLELKNGGRYAIILPTLENHYGDLMNDLRRLLR